MSWIPVDLDALGGQEADLAACGLSAQDLLEYLSRGATVYVARSRQPDRVDPERFVPLGYLTDGEWVWSLEAAAYVDRYGMRVPTEFIRRVGELRVCPEVSEGQLEAARLAVSSPPPVSPAVFMPNGIEGQNVTPPMLTENSESTGGSKDWPEAAMETLEALMPDWEEQFVRNNFRGFASRARGVGFFNWDDHTRWRRQWPIENEEPPGSFSRFYLDRTSVIPALPGIIGDAAKVGPDRVAAVVAVFADMATHFLEMYPADAPRTNAFIRWLQRFSERCHDRGTPFANRAQAQDAFLELADEETVAQFPEVLVPSDSVVAVFLGAVQGLVDLWREVHERDLTEPEYERLVAEAVLPVCIAIDIAKIDFIGMPESLRRALNGVDLQVPVSGLIEQTLAGESTALSRNWTAWKDEQRYVPPSALLGDAVEIRTDAIFDYLTLQYRTVDAVLSTRPTEDAPIVRALGKYVDSLPRTGYRINYEPPPIRIALTNSDDATTAEGGTGIDALVAEIDAIEGREALKVQLRELADVLRGAALRQAAGLPQPTLPWRFMILGEVGAGARDAARFIGRLYAAAHLISSDKVISCTPDQLIDAGSAGTTRNLVDGFVDRATDGVLFVESAGALLDARTEFGKAAIGHLAVRIGELRNTVVVVSETAIRMDELITQDQRYGRLFGDRWTLEDPSPDELQTAFLRELAGGHYVCEPNALARARTMMARLALQPSTRNFAAAHRVFEHATRRQSERIGAMRAPTADDLKTLRLEDFDPAELGLPDIETLSDVLQELDGLIGLDDLKRDVRMMADTAAVAVKRQKAGLAVPPVTRHLVFLGSAGTGKTTVARLLAAIYREQGLLRIGHLVETSRSGLIAEYTGQTGPKVQKVFESALGGVLFIDEAYALRSEGQNDNYGDEAVATLVKLMEDHRDDIVVIVAGYTREMARFMESNSGLASRFRRSLEFPDYSNAELMAIVERFVSKSDYFLDPQARSAIERIFAGIERTASFGNARYARRLFEETLSRQAQRIVGIEDADVDALRTILAEDVAAPAKDTGKNVSTGQYL